MKIETDNPNECHNMLFAALELYKAAHDHFNAAGVHENFATDEKVYLFECEHCKATLVIVYNKDQLIKSFNFNKRWCDT